MLKKLMFLGAGAVGYVLGAKAGRERYEQITTQAQKLRTNPTVQQKVDEAKETAKSAAETATEKVKEHRDSSSTPSGTSPGATSTPTGATGPRRFGAGNEGA
jgi:SLT domain-containing protein